MRSCFVLIHVRYLIVATIFMRRFFFRSHLLLSEMSRPYGRKVTMGKNIIQFLQSYGHSLTHKLKTQLTSCEIELRILFLVGGKGTTLKPYTALAARPKTFE